MEATACRGRGKGEKQHLKRVLKETEGTKVCILWETGRCTLLQVQAWEAQSLLWSICWDGNEGDLSILPPLVVCVASPCSGLPSCEVLRAPQDLAEIHPSWTRTLPAYLRRRLIGRGRR